MSSTTSRPASGVPGAASPPYVVEDCLGVLQILSDGTVKRAQPPLVLPDDDAALPAADNAPVKWKDVVYDEANKLSLRTFVPNAGTGDKKDVFFHGGGFVVGTFAMPDFHAACLHLAAELPAVVLSVDYHLAPERRLPAAHDDADTLLSWLRAQAAPDSTSVDPWLAERADFRRVFLSGDSAGANIAHNAAVRAGSGDGLRVEPALRVAGCVLLWPYFGGERRTASEAACPADTFLTLALYDQMWRIALPAGASRDHPAANPVGPDSQALDAVDLPPLLVATGDRDMLVDRIRDYVARLKAAGKRVEIVEFAGQAHAFAIFNPESEDAGELVRVVRKFVHGGAAQLSRTEQSARALGTRPACPDASPDAGA